MPVRVSVVVPVFNPGEHIEPCIDSLLRQTMPAEELELVFVDDGSTDGSGARLDRLARDHAHVKVVHEENSGWSGRPRNVGTDAATGEYVQYVDQDDLLREEALERLYAFAQTNDSDVVIGKMVGVNRRVPVQLFHESRALATIHDSPIIDSLTPHKMFRRSFLREAQLRFPEGRRRLEDHVFVLAAYFAARRISVLADYECYVHITREDRGNAAFAAIDWSGYFSNLREALDIVDAHTEPGPERDRLHRRWLRVEMVLRLRGHRFLRRDESEQRRLLHEISTVVSERFSPGVDAGLGAGERLVAALARRWDLEGLRALAHWEAGLRASATVTETRWDGPTLVARIEAGVVDREGAALLLVPSAAGPALLPPLPDETAAALLPEVHEDPAAVADVEVVARHLATGTRTRLPAHRVDEGERRTVGTTVEARLEPGGSAQNPPLLDGGWEVSVRLGPVRGRTMTVSATSPEADPARPCAALVGRPLRTAVPFRGPSGRFRLEVGARNKRATQSLQPEQSRSSVRVEKEGVVVRLGLPAPVHPEQDVVLRLTKIGRDGPDVGTRLELPATVGSRPAGSEVRAQVGRRRLARGRWRLAIVLPGADGRRIYVTRVALDRGLTSAALVFGAQASRAPTPLHRRLRASAARRLRAGARRLPLP